MTTDGHAGRLFADFGGTGDEPALSGLCLDLLKQQKDSWKDLREGYAAMDSLRLREVTIRENTVRLQFNLGRMASSAASVDPGSIRRRRCFLCGRNLPDAQKAIRYRGTYWILCNPAPIFPLHYTVCHRRHLPQAIESRIDAFLCLARDFGPGFSLFYNGPRCGASAPDHLHFQAAPRGGMPLEREIGEGQSGRRIKVRDEVSWTAWSRAGRRVILLEGENREALAAGLRRTFGVLKEVLTPAEEPMMNLLCTWDDARWRVLIFPRRKHRPDAYYREVGDRLLISPGTVDMGGLVIVPVERDFDRVTAEQIEQIFEEVSLDEASFDRVIDALR